MKGRKEMVDIRYDMLKDSRAVGDVNILLRFLLYKIDPQQ